jgi:tetratricopeptide (TPR) repeat protein
MSVCLYIQFLRHSSSLEDLRAMMVGSFVIFYLLSPRPGHEDSALYRKPSRGAENADLYCYGLETLYSELKEYDKAVQSYDTALHYDPNNPDAWDRKGLALGNSGKHVQALEYYNTQSRNMSNYHSMRG